MDRSFRSNCRVFDYYIANWIKDKRKLIKLKNAFWEEVESYQSEISQVTCDLVDEYLNPTRTRVTCGPNSSGHSYINALKVELGVELPQPIRQLTRHIEDRTKIICTGIAKRNEQAIDSKNKELKQRVSSKPFTNPTYSQQRTATAIVECCKLLHELMKALENKRAVYV